MQSKVQWVPDVFDSPRNNKKKLKQTDDEGTGSISSATKTAPPAQTQKKAASEYNAR